jgi:multidrug resistance efflux pump
MGRRLTAPAAAEAARTRRRVGDDDFPDMTRLIAPMRSRVRARQTHNGRSVPACSAAMLPRDPNNVEIELNFETKNETAA